VRKKPAPKKLDGKKLVGKKLARKKLARNNLAGKKPARRQQNWMLWTTDMMISRLCRVTLTRRWALEPAATEKDEVPAL